MFESFLGLKVLFNSAQRQAKRRLRQKNYGIEGGLKAQVNLNLGFQPVELLVFLNPTLCVGLK